MAQIITIAARKGGVAKTTTAVNLATALSRAGCSVVLIDADSQGQCADLLGFNPGDGDPVFADWLAGRLDLQDCALLDLDGTISGRPALVVGDGRTLAAEAFLSDDRARSLAGALRDQSARWGVEYVVIDSPPKGAFQDWAILACDLLIIPAAANRLGAQMALETADLAGLIGGRYNRQIDVLVLPVMVQAWTKDGKRWLDAIGVEFAGLLAPDPVPLAVVVAESGAAGVPVVEYAPRSRPALAYAALAAAVELRRSAQPVEVC